MLANTLPDCGGCGEQCEGEHEVPAVDGDQLSNRAGE
jgi:hypothetical protein